MTIEQMIERAHELGCDVFQICDDPRIETYSSSRLSELRDLANHYSIALELGTRGVTPEKLNAYLDLAQHLNANLIRSMVTSADQQPLANLQALMPRCEEQQVTIALETYEQISTTQLIEIVQRVDCENLGICLDPANCVSALEHPRSVIKAAAPYTVNLHVKDFAFTRADGWVGFRYAGAELGTGLLDLDYELSAVYSNGRNPSAIVEHWVVWQGDLTATVTMERNWTRTTLNRLRTYASSNTSNHH